MSNEKKTVVRLLAAATPVQAKIFQAQVNRFEEKNPEIETALVAVPYSEFNRLLLTLIQAGYPLDAAILSYNFVAQLQLEGSLMSLNSLVTDGDFLSDALESNTFDGQLYALPWVRSACLPHYRNLTLFSTSKHPDEAFKLIDFLSQPLQEIENFLRLKWFPCRKSVYDSLGIDCPPPSEIIRLAPEDVRRTIELVNERSPNLEPVLEGLQLNTYEATAGITNGEIEAAAAPGTDPISKEKFEAKLKDGIIVGALFANQELGIHNPSGDTIGTLGAGDYAIQLQADPEAPLGVRSYAVTPDGTEIELPLSSFEATSGPVIQPFLTVQPGSWIWRWCGFGYCWAFMAG